MRLTIARPCVRIAGSSPGESPQPHPRSRRRRSQASLHALSRLGKKLAGSSTIDFSRYQDDGCARRKRRAARARARRNHVLCCRAADTSSVNGVSTPIPTRSRLRHSGRKDAQLYRDGCISARHARSAIPPTTIKKRSIRKTRAAQTSAIPKKITDPAGRVLDTAILPLEDRYRCVSMRLLTDDRGIRSLVVSVNPTYLSKVTMSNILASTRGPTRRGG